MDYHISCPCGRAVTINEAAAGTHVWCECGQKVVIPSMRELRRLAGIESEAAPEMVVEAMLLADKLPQEDLCVLCGEVTDGIAYFRTECELAYVSDNRTPTWARVLALFTFSWVGFLIASSRGGEEREYGKDRIYTLPLRVCPACRPKLADPNEARAALRRVPLYDRLLQRFPQARVTFVQR